MEWKYFDGICNVAQSSMIINNRQSTFSQSWPLCFVPELEKLVVLCLPGVLYNVCVELSSTLENNSLCSVDVSVSGVESC